MSFARHGDVQIYYDTFGNAADEALLLISGLGSQCINYRDAFCRQLSAMGYFVIRFDNRDVGLSTKFDDVAVNGPSSSVVSAKGTGANYRLTDMAGDGLAVLDQLGIERAHVVGVSMGGMIAQTMAIEHPERLRSLTSIMSSTGDLDVGWPSSDALRLFQSRAPRDRDGFVALRLASARVWGSPGCFDEEELTAHALALFERNFCPNGVARQMGAIVRSGSRSAALTRVTIPTLVLHGDADTLIDPSGGRRTAAMIPGARFILIEGMGHDLAFKHWNRLADLLREHFVLST
ncbi:MAG: alpha/beta fold hydrolase [Acidimicrobiales bacterium]